MPTVSTDPLILTIALDGTAQAWFDKLRLAHFPPERNFLKAHLTLFHHLPAEDPQIIADLEEISRETPVLSLNATGLIHLGGGVAIKIENEKMQALHKNLQHRWQSFLTAQDKQKRRFHITIQNKVSPGAATSLLETLTAEFNPFLFSGTGLTLWTYRNGPWEWYRDFPFS